MISRNQFQATMKATSAAAICLLLALLSAAAQDQEQQKPLDLDQREDVEVRLVLIDALVVDKDGRTVPDLTIDDFEIAVDSELRPIDTLDVNCDAGQADDPRGVKRPRLRGAPVAPDAERSIVLALDYLHLTQFERVDVLEQAKEMVRHGATAKDQIMIVALNGGLRVEQSFTPDHQQVLKVLDRMEYDITLWQPSFQHLTEEPFFFGLQALMDILEQVPGSKAMVLFSNSPANATENDLRFATLAATASASRCAIYPVAASGLRTPPPYG